MTVEGLKTIFDWAAVILLGLTFISGLGILVTGNIINKRQAAQLRQFDGDLTAAKLALGKQEHDNLVLRGDLNTESGKVAGLQKNATDAKTAQRRVETELARQKERTARAEQAASDAALALAKFKAPRSLSPEHQNKLVADVRPFARQNFAFAVFPDPEPQALARVIHELLKSAGWNRVPSQIQREGGVLMDIAGESAAQISDMGIDAYIAPDDTESVFAQQALCSALTDSGLHCETHRAPQLAGKTPRAITIGIGKKP